MDPETLGITLVPDGGTLHSTGDYSLLLLSVDEACASNTWKQPDLVTQAHGQ